MAPSAWLLSWRGRAGLSFLAGVEALNVFVVGRFWFVELNGLHDFPEHVCFSALLSLMVCSRALLV